MSDEVLRKFEEVTDNYEAKFGESIGYEAGSQVGMEELIKLVQHCIDTNTRYKLPKIPDGCLS